MKITDLLLENKKNGGGDCFNVAGRAMLEQTHGKEAKLIHAFVSGQGPLKGVRYAHAWNEVGNVVFDYSNGRNLELPKEFYYQLGEVSEAEGEYAIYNLTEAFSKFAEHMTFGPWDLDESKGHI